MKITRRDALKGILVALSSLSTPISNGCGPDQKGESLDSSTDASTIDSTITPDARTFHPDIPYLFEYESLRIECRKYISGSVHVGVGLRLWQSNVWIVVPTLHNGPVRPPPGSPISNRIGHGLLVE